MDESQKKFYFWLRRSYIQIPDTKEYFLYDFIYMKYRKMQDSFMVVGIRTITVSGKNHEKLSEEIEMFYNLIEVVVTWKYTLVNQNTCKIMTTK